MTIMEEQRTENEFRVESDKQLLFHEDLFLFFFPSLSLSQLIPFPRHPPPPPTSLALSLSLSQLHSSIISLSLTLFFFSVVFVCVVSKCTYALSLSQVSLYCFFCVHYTFTCSITN
jgi:hypothetical protein